jgi:hypothetical protein
MIGGVAVSRLMAGRKITPKNQKDSRQPLRFTSGEIVRTIDAVQAAGLTVYGVEITLAGAINISTQPTLPSVSKRPTTLRQVTETDLVDETTPNKKLV